MLKVGLGRLADASEVLAVSLSGEVSRPSTDGDPSAQQSSAETDEAPAAASSLNLPAASPDGVTRLTFAFRDSYGDGSAIGFTRFDEAQIAQTLAVLQAWSDVANVVFTRVGSGGGGDQAYSNAASLLFGNYGKGSPTGGMSMPGLAAPNSDTNIWVKQTLDQVLGANPNYLATSTYDLILKVGAALGLSSSAGAASLQDESAPLSAPSMAYAATPLLNDIAAAQKLYGANMSTRTGDTVYGFNSTADRDWFAAGSAQAPAKLAFAVWDAGGIDTFDFSGYDNDQKIDLTQGAYSDVGGRLGKVAISTGVVIENAIGGSGADTILGNGADNRLLGGAGADTISGYGGMDQIEGGDGNDTPDGGDGDDRLWGGSGNDSLTGGAGLDRLYGGAGADNLDGGDGDDLVIGDAGNDRLSGAAGSDRLEGGAGNDILTGGDGDDDLFGGDGDDALYGGAGNDALWGEAGNDRLIGEDGNDTLYGGAGADLLLGLLGNDVLNGGDGDDQIEGGDGTDTLSGGADNDLILAGAGDDIASGDEGDDLIYGNAGNDSLAGGDGDDSLFGDDGNDRLFGGTGRDNLYGGQGDDRLESGSGDDYLWGDEGNDSLYGGDGTDQMFGGDGDDILVGGAGKDYLTGGAGKDRFIFNSVSDSRAGEWLQDALTELNLHEDIIDLSAVDADSLTPGDQAFHWVDSFTGHAGEAVLKDGQFMADVNGDGIADFAFYLFCKAEYLTKDEGWVL